MARYRSRPTRSNSRVSRQWQLSGVMACKVKGQRSSNGGQRWWQDKPRNWNRPSQWTGSSCAGRRLSQRQSGAISPSTGTGQRCSGTCKARNQYNCQRNQEYRYLGHRHLVHRNLDQRNPDHRNRGHKNPGASCIKSTHGKKRQNGRSHSGGPNFFSNVELCGAPSQVSNWSFRTLLRAAAFQNGVRQGAAVPTAADHTGNFPLVRQPITTGEQSVVVDPQSNHLSWNHPGRSNPQTLQLITLQQSGSCGVRLMRPAHNDNKVNHISFFLSFLSTKEDHQWCIMDPTLILWCSFGED